MGVSRALGFTRWTLVRLILAEAVLVGVVTYRLSVEFGITSGWRGSGMSQYVSFFGGLSSMLVIPVAPLTIGV